MPTLDELRRRYQEGAERIVVAPRHAEDTIKPSSGDELPLHPERVDVTKMRRAAREDKMAIGAGTRGESDIDKVEDKGKSGYKHSKTGRYTIAADGKDVRLHFGRYNGEQVSAILRSGKEGRSYVAWMLSPSQDFHKDLLDVVRYLKDEYDKEVAASRAIARSKVRGL